MWSWKPDAKKYDILAPCNQPIFPRMRGRRHSFPPPSSYNSTNSPRWKVPLPHKYYTNYGTLEDPERRSGRILPEGRLFIPPPRDGTKQRDSSVDEFWGSRSLSRRMSGSLEGFLADDATARNPAFIAPYFTPRQPSSARPCESAL